MSLTAFVDLLIKSWREMEGGALSSLWIWINPKNQWAIKAGIWNRALKFEALCDSSSEILTSLGDLEPPSRNVGLHLKLICHLKRKVCCIRDKQQTGVSYLNKPTVTDIETIKQNPQRMRNQELTLFLVFWNHHLNNLQKSQVMRYLQSMCLQFHWWDPSIFKQ